MGTAAGDYYFPCQAQRRTVQRQPDQARIGLLGRFENQIITISCGPASGNNLIDSQSGTNTPGGEHQRLLRRNRRTRLKGCASRRAIIGAGGGVRNEGTGDTCKFALFSDMSDERRLIDR